MTRAPQFGVGHDALVVVGLLALARASIAASAWDTSSGFGLMSAGRDLTFAVAGEALLLLVLVTAALPVGTTDLPSMWQGASGTGIWAHPAHWCGLVGMLMIAVLETGRQPVDNPDTHLELTMVHEGPLLEYAGRDLAYLLGRGGASLGGPRAGGRRSCRIRRGLPAWSWCSPGGRPDRGTRALETVAAKMRLLRVPPLPGATCLAWWDRLVDRGVSL